MAELAVGASLVLLSTQSLWAGDGGHVDPFSLILIYSAGSLRDFTSEGAFHLPPLPCPQVTACSVSQHASCPVTSLSRGHGRPQPAPAEVKACAITSPLRTYRVSKVQSESLLCKRGLPFAPASVSVPFLPFPGMACQREARTPWGPQHSSFHLGCLTLSTPSRALPVLHWP